jgi:lysine/ornithine N-monooxygenase
MIHRAGDTALTHTSSVQALIDGDGLRNPYKKLPPEIRQQMLATTVASVFPTVNLETLESLYATLYLQHVRSNDASQHRFMLHPFSQIIRASKTAQGVLLHSVDVRTGEAQTPLGPFDFLLTEVYRDARQGPKILAPIRPLLEKQTLTVDSEYNVNFHRNTFSSGSGLWMLGSLASQNMRRDDLSILAASAHRAVSSITRKFEASDASEVETQSRL